MNILLKKLIFPILALVIIVTAMLIEHEYYEIIGEKHIPFVSHGLSFSTMPPKNKTRVILIGNSVLRSSNIVKHLMAFEADDSINFEIGNFSGTGGSIADYIIAYNYIKQFDPDVVVFHILPMTFGVIKPLYRQVSKKLIAKPYMRELWRSPILETFSKDELADSLLYSYFPFIRRLPIIRHNLKAFVNQYAKKWFLIPVMNWFPYSLSPGEDWLILKRDKTDISDMFPESENLLRFLADQLKKDRQPAIFIFQETQPPTPGFLNKALFLLKEYSNISVYDFRGYYKKEIFVDQDHPSKEGAAIVAKRIYAVIRQHINNL